MSKNLFENTVVLSLTHRFDRRDHVTKEMKKHGIPFKFHDAVNGYEVPRNASLLPGEIGIKISHIEILEKAKQDSLESIFIFEDDVVLDERIHEIIKENIQFIPDDCGLVYLGGAHRGFLNKIGGVIHKTCSTYTTHAMWLHQSLFDEAIKVITSYEDQQLDNCYVILQERANACTFYPNAAWQKDDYSDIQSKFVNYGWLK